MVLVKRNKAADKIHLKCFSAKKREVEEHDDEKEAEVRQKRSDIARSLLAGEPEEEKVTIEVTEQQPSLYDAFQGSGMEQMGANMQDALSSLMPKKKANRKMKVKDARLVLESEEADKLIDHDEIARNAIELTEQSGIIFLDEMDKIARSEGSGGHQLMYRAKVCNAISCRSWKVLRFPRNTVR